MTIWVADAIADARTELAAFDSRLVKVGIGNLNLLFLSSVIPPGSRIARGPVGLQDAGCGRPSLLRGNAEAHFDYGPRGMGWAGFAKVGKLWQFLHR